MKKVILNFALFIFCSTISVAQFTFSVVPRTFTDEINVERTVTGIQARIISQVDLNLSDSTFNRTFYVAFIQESGKPFREFNTNTDEFIDRLVKAGASETLAKTNITTICRLLEYGTKQEKYAAAAQLAGNYGYTLKPLSEQ